MKTKCFVVLTVVLLILALFISVTPNANAVTKGGPIPKYHGVTVRVLVDGSPIRGSNGLYFGPDGNLYIASCWGHEIIKMDPDSGHILARIGQESGVFSPDDLVFGPDGSLYWTSILTGVIGKLTPDGNYSAFANLGPGVNPITFSPDNEWIYIARDFLDKGLFKIRPDGSELTPLLPDIVNLNAFDFGPDGCLYGPIFGQKVIKINVDTDTPIIEDLITGISPSAVKFDSQGRLYTNDNATGKVFRYDLETGEQKVLATLPFQMDNLAIDSHNQIYVSGIDGYIARILRNGKYVIISPGGMIFPSGVAVLQRPDGGESVYVGDMWSLPEFDGQTGEMRSFEVATIGSLLNSYPLSLATDGDNLLVASIFSYVIQEYDPINHTVLNTYSNPIFPGVPFMPVNAIRFDGDIVATDYPTGLVVRRISDVWTPIFGVPFSGGMPVGLATNGSDLWVTDYVQGKVFKIYPSPDTVAMNLDGPAGLAYYPPDGSLLVVEATAGRLSKIDPTTGEKIILADGLELGDELIPGIPTIAGVTVGPSGTIYVTGNKENVLYRIKIHR